MGYIERNLVPGETVVYESRLHWIVLVRPLVVGLLLGSIGLVFVIGGYEASGKDVSYGGMIFVGVLLLTAAAISVSGGLIKKSATEVAVSNKRVSKDN